MNDTAPSLSDPRAIDRGRSSPAANWLPAAAFLAVTLVGIHAVVDPASYDVSQQPRLLVTMILLLVAAPIVLRTLLRLRSDRQHDELRLTAGWGS